jgi:tetratricopeptide (TPR) repeat protein
MRHTIYIFAILCIFLAGCSSTRQKSQTEQATIQWNKTRAEVLAGLATDQYRNGNLDKAKETLDSALRMDSTNPQLHVLAAKLAIEQSSLEAAERSLETARALDPKNAEADYLSGVIYQRWQRPDTSLTFYASANEKAPGELAYLMARAEMLVVLNRPDEALSLLQAKVQYFDHSGTIRDAAGQLLARAGKYDQAIDMLRQATILAEDDLTIREHLALVLFESKHYREAADVLDPLLKLKSYSARPDLLSALGECQMQLGRYRDARATFESAAAMDSSSVAIWLSYGKAALQLNDLPRAELAVKNATALAPKSSEVALMRGYVRFKQNQLPDALAAFKQAYELDQADTVSLCMVGYVLEKTGKPAQAKKCYTRALQLNPNDEMAGQLMATLGPQE